MKYLKMSISILPVFLLMGVAMPRTHDDGDVFQPIMTRSKGRRICAELCMSGLGGDPCGETCVDLTPQELPLQSETEAVKAGSKTRNNTRKGACPLLCANQLGYPLCNCSDVTNVQSLAFYDVNFDGICLRFCFEYNYRIYGCDECKAYKQLHTKNSGTLQTGSQMKLQTINWNKWCSDQCYKGEGGAACNCDLLPLSI